MTAIGVIVALIVAVVGVAAGYFIGYNNRKKTAEAQIGSAEAEATRLVNEAIKTADQKRKEAVLEAKDEAFRLTEGRFLQLSHKIISSIRFCLPFPPWPAPSAALLGKCSCSARRSPHYANSRQGASSARR